MLTKQKCPINLLNLAKTAIAFETMAEEIVSLGCDDANEIAFDETILPWLRETWDEEVYAFVDALEAFYHTENQEDWFLDDDCSNQSLDGEELMPSQDNEWLLAGARKSEQQGANPLFSVLRERIHRPRRWQGGAVRQEHFRLQLEQNRPPTDELLGEAVAEAFYQNVRDYVAREKLNPARFKLQMKIHHNGDGVNVWTSSPVLPLEDWINNKERTRQWIQQLSNELNSSQNMDVSKDDFFAEVTLIYQPPSGGRLKKHNIKSLSYDQILKKKRCIITICNTDELCCARAIVTLKARHERDPQYMYLQRGRRIQTKRAKQLHRDANVAEGPCGQAELEAFQAHLGPEYQLMVLEGMKGHILFKNSVFDDAPHIIALLKTNQHYHAITSVPAFLNRGYFCRFCEKGYNQESADNHNCRGQNCPACRRSKNRCRNFATFVQPTHPCPQCNRVFYGPECLATHRTGKKPVCTRFAKCQECCKVYARKKGHACYTIRCVNCQRVQHVNHRCFIQPLAQQVVEEQQSFEEEEAEALEEDQTDAGKKEKPPPLIVAFDIECEAQDIEDSEDKVFAPVLIGWSTLGEVDDYHEVTTIAEFLDEMFSKTEFEGEDRQVYCYAHNLRAFDGLFIQEELYSKGYTIDGILNQGAKYLSFECNNLIFRDSMNFFSMPLERLSSTFNLRELHKGFFPYSWISKDSEGYVGEFPPAEDYHPERMSEKRRKEFYTWYQQQQGKEFNYDRELSLYLKSDVLVLKEALTAFSSEMFDLTEVKPLTECVTIASTAFRVWQRNFLEPDLIALEPQAGWRSNRVNQSKEALEWLAHENVLIGGGIRVSIDNLQYTTW